MKKLTDSYVEEILKVFPKGGTKKSAARAYLLTDGMLVVQGSEINSSRLYDSMEKAKIEWELIQEDTWMKN